MRISSSNHSRALVVDDDVLSRAMMKVTLSGLGFEVFEASNGRECLDCIGRLFPDIILLDVVMPEMDGFETCRALRSYPAFEQVPVIMVTGTDDIGSIGRAYECGASDFIGKPINSKILAQRVRYVMRAVKALTDLKASELRLATAQRMAGLANWEWNLRSRKFYCSPNTWNLLRMSLETTPDGPSALLRAVHPSDRKTLFRILRRLRHDRGFESVHHRVSLPDGDELIVQHRIERTTGGPHNEDILAGTVLDVTEQKRSEWLEKDRSRIMELIISGQSLRVILHHVALAIERQVPSSACYISRVVQDALRVMAAPGLDPLFVKRSDAVPLGHSACGVAVQQGSPVVVADLHESPLWNAVRDLVPAAFRASISVPVVCGKGSVLGAICLLLRDGTAPSERVQQLMEKMAQLCSIAMEQSELNEQLVFHAQHDVLTGLQNRHSFMSRLDYALSHAARYGKKVGLVYVDLDRFKQVNDSLGHHIGDLVLQKVAERLRACTRESDSLARIGGDEFMSCLYPIDGAKDASRAVERLLELLNQPFEVEGRELMTVASIGISIYPDDAEDARTLQRNADIAMYHAKNEGGNRYRFFTKEMNEAVIDRLQIENDLRKALERQEFELYYQPQFDLASRELVGFEALLRWNHPTMGKVPPIKFIPVAEETALIIPIGRWVMREACRQAVEWQSKGLGARKMAVNISGIHFIQRDFVSEVKKILEETGMRPELLQLEVTETTVLKNLQVTAQNMEELKKIGVTTAIDDFGTGYCSMSYLQELSVDCIKIDRSFVRRIVDAKDDADRSKVIIRSFVMLARSLGLELVAEGVENIQQQEFLLASGCNLAQGFLLSTPLPKEDADKLLALVARGPKGQSIV